jgi:hypothetical protein
MDGHFTNAMFMLVELFATAPRPLRGRDTPQLEVSMRALILVEGIVSVCCEFWLDKQELNSY